MAGTIISAILHSRIAAKGIAGRLTRVGWDGKYIAVIQVGDLHTGRSPAPLLWLIFVLTMGRPLVRVIPVDKLAPEALQGVIEEFISRAGTDYGKVRFLGK
mgnify:CR=1 FL=1